MTAPSGGQMDCIVLGMCYDLRPSSNLTASLPHCFVPVFISAMPGESVSLLENEFEGRDELGLQPQTDDTCTEEVSPPTPNAFHTPSKISLFEACQHHALAGIECAS